MISNHPARRCARGLASAATLCSILSVAAPGCVADPGSELGQGAVDTVRVRMGHWNIKELGTAKLVEGAQSPQLQAMAEILARFQPDFLSVNELQFDIENVPEQGLPGAPAATQPGNACEGRNARRLADRLHELQPTLEYDYTVVAMGNSGVPFVTTEEVADEFHVRPDEYLGRYSLGLLSRYPILHDQVRVLHDLAWSALPGNRIDRIREELGIEVPEGYWLFEKAIVVVPIDVQGITLYVVLLHPMTSGFSEMNPHRNHDELRALTLWLSGELDAPGWEPLPEDARFIIVGDLNIDPEDGAGDPDSIAQVLANPRVVAHFPESAGGTKGTNPRRNSFISGCGNADGHLPTNVKSKLQLQLDYMLPSATIGQPVFSEIFFPPYPSADWTLACRASDHRFVYEDLDLH